MIPAILRRPISGELVVIDSQFPQKEPMGFRNIEVNEYLKRFSHIDAYAMYPMKPGPEAWFEHGYGIDFKVYQQNKKGYLNFYPQNAKRIHYLHKNRRYKFKLAYSFFLAETFTLLPFYEKHNIPFVFVLYPGGAFGLDNEASDNMLRRIFESPCFRKVIVSQRLTRDYLITKQLCDAGNIEYVYGGFVQFKPEDVKPKRYYNKHKDTFDLCFIASKYTEKGIDKGYDLFIESAKILAKKFPDMRFHVVGNFTEHDIDITDIQSKVIFYGYQKSDFFPNFYAGMDVMISPNRPHKLYEGNFDGFPLAVDAGYCGTAMFVSDELKMNDHFTNHKDIVIVPVDAKKIAQLVTRYYTNIEALYEISKRGMKASHKFFSIEQQLKGRIDLLSKVYKDETGEPLS